MDAYTDFASVYDTFMDQVPYEEWGKRLQELLTEHGITQGVVVELGCGTGSMTEILAQAGYDMIGIDNSEEMLGIASKKKEQSGNDILYLLQDMREFELYSSANAFISVCDSVNYILESEDLIATFQNVARYLEDGGIFIFDFNTLHKYRDVIGDTTIAEDREECSFIWDNYYYEDEKVNEYELSLFIQSKENRDLYHKFQETHYQKAYSWDDIQKIIKASKLTYVASYDAYTTKKPTDLSERICVVLKKEAGERT